MVVPICFSTSDGKKNMGAVFRGKKASYTQQVFNYKSSTSVNLSNLLAKKKPDMIINNIQQLTENNEPSIPTKFLLLQDMPPCYLKHLDLFRKPHYPLQTRKQH
jgi:hypothetical protein